MRPIWFKPLGVEVALVEAFCWVVLVLGGSAVSLRLSSTGRTALVVVASTAWAFLPWLTSDLAARSSLTRFHAWIEDPDHAGGIAALMLVEGFWGGLGALRQLATTTANGHAKQPSRSIPRLVFAMAPSPSFALGVFGAQILLYHHVSGYELSWLDRTLATGIFGLLIGMTLFLRSRWVLPTRPAELSVVVSIGLLALGGALPLVVHRQMTHSTPVLVDSRATLMLAGVVLVVSGTGFLLRFIRMRRGERQS